MGKAKTTTPQVAEAARPLEPYEQGVLDALEMLRTEVSRMGDANREAVRVMWNAAPEVQSLLNFASPALNIVGDVENRVVQAAMRRLNERRQAAKVSP